MMISMVDTDGDGQVSYDEFYRLVVDPDPARADFATDPTTSESKETAAVTQASRSSRNSPRRLSKIRTSFAAWS